MRHQAKARMLALPVATALGLAALAFGVPGPEHDVSAGIQGAPPPPESYSVVGGFTTELGPGGGIDGKWSRVTGGDQRVVLTDVTVGADQSSQAPIGIELDELVLQGSLLGDTTGGQDRVPMVFANQFAVDLLGIGTDIIRVEIEPWEVSVHPVAQDPSSQFREFSPGPPVTGDITFTMRRGDDSQTIADWWQQTIQGQLSRHPITIEAHNLDQTVARQWSFLDCAIVAYSALGYGLGSSQMTVAVETFTVHCERLEFGLPSGGHPRRPFIQQLVDTIQGSGQAILPLQITELDRTTGADLRTYTFIDAFPVRYVFPVLDGTSEDLWLETIVYKPHRLEIS